VFSSIVVPLDMDVLGDRALPLAHSLAQLGHLPIELVTVTPPRMEELNEAWEIDRRAKEYGIGPHSVHVLYDDDTGRAITTYMSTRDDPLLVMASTTKGPIGERLFGSVSEFLLANARRPSLIVGPYADLHFAGTPPTLVACVDGSTNAEAAVPVIVSWLQTFGGETVVVVEVVSYAAVAIGTLEVAPVETDADRFARLLTEHGVEASCRTLNGGAPATRLQDFALDVKNAVLVTTSRHWTGSKPNWHSTTRALARRSARPVLVVPAE
jgi:nucleotide-binding universal stress UspA family protein